MAEQDTVPTARMHWARLVLGGGHPFIVIIVLTIVGAGICWFSLQQISSITQTPTRYVMRVELHTEGCDDFRPTMFGDIGSFGPSSLQLNFFDDDRETPMLREGCWLRSFVLGSNLALQPTSLGDVPELIRVYGRDLNAHAEAANGDPGQLPGNEVERFRATVVEGVPRALDEPDPTGTAPSFSMRVEEDEEDEEEFTPIEFRQPRIHYEVAFVEEWQPLYFSVFFKVPENVRTYFQISGRQLDRDAPAEGETRPAPEEEEEEVLPESDEPAFSYHDLDISVSFSTDEVSVIRGMMSDSGNAESIYGAIRFGIGNSDAESRRESGNVRYSAVLGIGIALVVEAFVILLAIAMRALATRLRVAGAGRPAGGDG